jgi:hypothetical protein
MTDLFEAYGITGIQPQADPNYLMSAHPMLRSDYGADLFQSYGVQPQADPNDLMPGVHPMLRPAYAALLGAGKDTAAIVDGIKQLYAQATGNTAAAALAQQADDKRAYEPLKSSLSDRYRHRRIGADLGGNDCDRRRFLAGCSNESGDLVRHHRGTEVRHTRGTGNPRDKGRSRGRRWHWRRLGARESDYAVQQDGRLWRIAGSDGGG